LFDLIYQHFVGFDTERDELKQYKISNFIQRRLTGYSAGKTN